MHTISVNMSAQPQCQVGDKQEWSDNRDYIIVEFPRRHHLYTKIEMW